MTRKEKCIVDIMAGVAPAPHIIVPKSAGRIHAKNTHSNDWESPPENEEEEGITSRDAPLRLPIHEMLDAAKPQYTKLKA